MRLAGVAVFLMLAASLLRRHLGDIPPFDHPLQISALRTLPNYAPNPGNTRLVAQDSGFWATFFAPWRFFGEYTQQLGARGMPPFLIAIAVVLAVWSTLAYYGAWRRPPIGFVLLLVLQTTGSAYYLSTFRAPARKLATVYSAFDFHVHTTHSSGLLTPQQQIEWHRIRGFNGLAFTDSDRAMPETELASLRVANPDMLLLNGCEYHGSNHILFLNISQSISARKFSPAAAIREAKRQGGLSVVAHPWWPVDLIHPGSDKSRGDTGVPSSLDAYRQLGVDGFEAFNGVIWSLPVVSYVRSHALITTTATDTLSKSGSQCFTWTILPRGLKKPSDVVRALRLHKIAAAFALGNEDTPEDYDNAQRRLRGPSGLVIAAGAALSTFSRAEKFSITLGVISILSLLCAWGAEPQRKGMQLEGPQRVVSFLRRRRLALRSPGIILMILAWMGSAIAAIFCFAAGDHPHRLELLPAHALYIWIALDIAYAYGLSLWNRTL